MEIRVLLVDDDADTVEMMALLLESQGFKPFLATNSYSALEIAQETHPHAGIIDIGLPDLSGIELCRLLRQERWAREMVLIAVTGWANQDGEARSAGYNHCLLKPADPQALINLIRDSVRCPPARAEKPDDLTKKRKA